MDYSDIVKLRGELQSFEINNYPKSSRMTRDVGRKRLLHELVQAINPEREKANYVYMLMGLGHSRSGAYAIVTEAYKIIQDNKNTAMTQTKPKPEDPDTTAAKATEAPVTQTVPADAMSVPVTTPAPRDIQWPDEVEKVMNQQFPNLEVLVAGIWRIGVMRREDKVDKTETQQPLEQALAKLTQWWSGKFSKVILNGAFHAGWHGREPPLDQLVSIAEDPHLDVPELGGKRASIFIPDAPTKQKKEQINMLLQDGDEVTIFMTTGERLTDSDSEGKIRRINTLTDAVDRVRGQNAVTVVIHAH